MRYLIENRYEDYLKKDAKVFFPSRVIVELTNQCNILCRMCPRRYSRMEKGFLNYGLFKKIIDEISAHPKTGLIPFFRGESILHPQFIKMMKYAKSMRIRPIQLATNGILFTEDIAHVVLNLGIDFISFSLDTIHKDVYSKVRIGSKYNIVIKNIEYLIKEKKSRRLKLPEIQVSMVETSQTRASKRDFITYWVNKVDRVRIYREHSADGVFGRIGEKGERPLEKRKPCSKLISEMAVYCNGDVAICNHDWNRKESIGSVEGSSIADVWNSEAYRTLRMQHFENNIAGGTVCARCNYWIEHYVSGGKIGDLYTRANFHPKRIDTQRLL